LFLQEFSKTQQKQEYAFKAILPMRKCISAACVYQTPTDKSHAVLTRYAILQISFPDAEEGMQQQRLH